MITNTVLELAVCTVADKPVAEEARRAATIPASSVGGPSPPWNRTT